MRNDGPTSNLLMFQAVLFWIISWWLAELIDGEPMGVAVSVICALVAMGLAVGSATHAVSQPSPFANLKGRALWAVRPRKWMIAWAFIVGLVLVFGQPMMLWHYGGGSCQYIDWWLEPHWLKKQGDGLYQGCRFLAVR